MFYGEVYPNHLRAKGLAITVTVNCLSSVVYMQVAATAFANVGWKYYLVSLHFGVKRKIANGGADRRRSCL